MPVSSSPMWRKRAAKLYAAEKRIQDLQSTRSRSLRPGDEAKREKALRQATQEKQQLQQGFHLNIQVLLGIILAVTIGLAIARAFMEGSLIALFTPPSPEELPDVAADFTVILAPLLAVSVAVERLLETGFNWFEQSSQAVANVLVTPKEMLDWAGREYQKAYKATEEAAEMVGVSMTPETLQLLDMTEERLVKAEERLRGWTKSPEYLSWKRALSICFGLLVGLVVSVLGDLRMFYLIGISSPPLVDMIITGLIIGSGSGPTHDFIGILQSGKDALGSVKDLAQGSSIRQAVEELQKAQAQAMQNGGNNNSL